MIQNKKKRFFNSCEWNKESLFRYLKNNITDGYKIIYHQNNIVGVNITKQETMFLLTMGIVKKLCYGTIPEIWDYYINNDQSSKFFLFFNFNVEKKSSKSIYSILSQESDENELVLMGVDKYHNQKREDFGNFCIKPRYEISNKLNLDRKSLFNSMKRALKPNLEKPNVQLTYIQCLELEKQVLKF